DHAANLINARSSDILFTGSATESINLALKGLAFANIYSDKASITAPTEHEAVLQTVQQLKEQMQQSVLFITVDRSGCINLDELHDRVSAKQALVVSLMYANNEIGTIYPIAKISELVHENGALLFVDATQAVGKIPVDVQGVGI